jgi:hypothetical protein
VQALPEPRACILVGIPALPKFQSFADHVGRSGDLVQDWSRALDLAQERMQRISQRIDALSPNITASLDEHWLAIVKAINSDDGNSGRNRFLRFAAQHSLRSSWPAMMCFFTEAAKEDLPFAEDASDAGTAKSAGPKARPALRP